MVHNFKTALSTVSGSLTRRINLEVLQVNLGNICNQRCRHCHINAGPQGDKIMPRRIINDIVRFLSRRQGLIMDVTGGCPELNPHFKYLIESAKGHTKKIIVRSNLTILLEPDLQGLPQFYKDNQVKLICSLPCYTQENVDRQRGPGVFTKSILALRLLNQAGYAERRDLELDLVYNPGGAFLPARQSDLERDYKRILKQQYGIAFNHLLTMTNAPINRFKQYLRANENFDQYMQLLMDNFNKDIVSQVMCRSLLSVGWDGIIYDCDFNQALGLAIRDQRGKIMEIASLSPEDLEEKEIVFENHCFCCTAGSGSSCSGALKQ